MPTIRSRQVTVAHASRALVIIAISLSACTSSTEPRKNALAHLNAVSPTSLTGVVGTLLVSTPAVRATDADGRVLSGIEVSFTTNGDDVIGQRTVTTDSSGTASVGQWKLGVKPGAHTVTARSGGLAIVFTATANAGPVASLLPVEGDWQTAEVGGTLPAPLIVRAVDAFANPVRGAVVSFSVQKGGGSIGSDSAVTGSDGMVSVSTWRLGDESGPQEVRAESGSAHFVFTALACDESKCADILFVRAGNIYRFDSRGVRQLTYNGQNGEPVWSPDGQRIAFAHASAPESIDTFVMNADGSNPQRVTSGFPLQSPSWSPDGKSLALAGDWWLCVYNCSIYELKLTDPPGAVQFIAPMGTDPDWSPDGEKIVYVSLSGDDGYQALFAANADGTDISELTPRDEGAIFGPKWSPDGKKIAFSKCILARCDIYILDYGSSVLTQLTSVGRAYYPTWSPDGMLVAFTRGPSDSSAPSSIEYVPVHGTAGEPIHVLTDAYSPSWRR